MNDKTKEDSLTLGILEAIDERSDVTQRHLARRLNVALGLANSYLRRCVRKGLVKIQQAPANRYVYYLTPKGFAEKGRLTAQYLSYSFEFYRQASDSCNRAMMLCKRQEWSDVLLCGVSELAEIASLRAMEHGIRVVGVLDPQCTRESFLGRDVLTGIDAAPRFDACLVTALSAPQAWLEVLRESVPGERIVVPDLLGSRHHP